jgi:hypothetical protein
LRLITLATVNAGLKADHRKLMQELEQITIERANAGF